MRRRLAPRSQNGRNAFVPRCPPIRKPPSPRTSLPPHHTLRRFGLLNSQTGFELSVFGASGASSLQSASIFGAWQAGGECRTCRKGMWRAMRGAADGGLQGATPPKPSIALASAPACHEIPMLRERATPHLRERMWGSSSAHVGGRSGGVTKERPEVRSQGGRSRNLGELVRPPNGGGGHLPSSSPRPPHARATGANASRPASPNAVS